MVCLLNRILAEVTEWDMGFSFEAGFKSENSFSHNICAVVVWEGVSWQVCHCLSSPGSQLAKALDSFSLVVALIVFMPSSFSLLHTNLIKLILEISQFYPALVEHVFNLITLKEEAVGSLWVHVLPGVYIEFQSIQGCYTRNYLLKNKIGHKFPYLIIIK